MILLCNHYFWNFAHGMATLIQLHTHILSNVKTQHYYIWTQNITNITRTLHVGWLGLPYGAVVGRPNRWYGLIGPCRSLLHTYICIIFIRWPHTVLYIYFLFTFLAFSASPVPWPIHSTSDSQPHKQIWSIHYVVIIGETWSVIFTCRTWWWWPS